MFKIRKIFTVGFFLFFLTLIEGLFAADPFNPNDSDYIKWGPKLVTDALMPSDMEIRQVGQWLENVFTGKTESNDFNAVRIEVLKQNHARLRFNESCMGNPLGIGNTSYSKGLGTHAASEIRLTFPEPIISLSAKVGIDANGLTAGKRGSVIFIVTADNKEIFRSPVKKGGDEATVINLQFKSPIQKIVLKTDPTSDGESCDQCDWAELKATGTSGIVYIPSDNKRIPLAALSGKYRDVIESETEQASQKTITSQKSASQTTALKSTEKGVFYGSAKLPFSFKYGGISSRDLLNSWKFEAKNIDAFHDRYSWRDPKTDLVVCAEVRRFEKFAGADWVLTFKNNGKKNSLLIEDVLVLDANFDLGQERESLAIHTLMGDSCSATSWLPTVIPVTEGKDLIRFAPVGGRPSNGAFPFWNLVRSGVSDSEPTEGIFVALGWSGQWRAEFAKPKFFKTTAKAGMEKIATVLYPDEEIRSPRVLIMPWRTDRLSSQALFRRLLMFEYTPKEAGGLPQEIGLIGQCFDRYYRKRPGWEKFESQVEFARHLKAAGCTRYWFDAAWFPVGFPNGVGNWFSDKTNFPQGLEALGNEIEKLGLSFVLWFEPERVARGTQLADEYPQYVFGGKNGGLFKLNDSQARRFLTDLVSKRISDYKVGVYRTDFNIDPLPFWRANDEKDRVGMTEIRYVEGHYLMWNELRQRHPGLWIDNCASGGRRIDLETTALAIPLWRSDTCCRPDRPDWDQNQSIGIAQYLPLFSSVAWDSSPYTFRSVANPGCIMQYNFLDADYDPVQSKKSVNEARSYQKFWYGDFYPLTGASTDKRGITAWQLHRPDLEAGLVYVFRQSESPYLGITLDLRAIEPESQYKINIKNGYEIEKSLTITGTEFLKYPALMSEKKSCRVIEYQKIQKK